MTTQNLNTVINVVVMNSPAPAPQSNFNVPLFVGNSTVIGTVARVRLYTSLSQMITDGFLATSAEYLQAQAFVQNFYFYFGQGAAYRFYVGEQAAGETALVAYTACRNANSEWYVGIVTGAADADHEVIAQYNETCLPPSIYCITNADAAVLSNTAGNLLATLQTANYNRTMFQYSTSANQTGLASAMAYAMGQNTLVGNYIAQSSYTMKFKQCAGVVTEALTSAQIVLLESLNANVYLNYNNYYNVFEQGVMVNGAFFDQVTQLDMLSNRIQLAIANLLYQNSKIAQTDAGVSQLIHGINMVCSQFVTVGFLAPGIWTGLPVLNLNTGDTLTLGYGVQAVPIAQQSTVDRAARKCPDIYVAVKLAGAIHSALIQVNVNA